MLSVTGRDIHNICLHSSSSVKSADIITNVIGRVNEFKAGRAEVKDEGGEGE